MSQKRMHQVNTGKKKKNPNHIGTITQADLLNMDRAARRSAAVASGHNPAAGCGIHGGNKKQRNKRDRRDSKLASRNHSED